MGDEWRTEQRELNAALAKAQASFPTIGKDRTVEVDTKSGGKYRYSYATLSGILAAVRPVLAENGLAVVQLLGADDESGRPELRTELRHSGGGILAASFPLPVVPDDPQRLGSLLTYLRRYALSALLGIAADEDDDDGAKAKGPARRQSRKEPDTGASGAQVQQLFGELRAKETERGFPNRDWTNWTRTKLGLASGEVATAEHWRRAVPILQRELAQLEGAEQATANDGD